MDYNLVEPYPMNLFVKCYQIQLWSFNKLSNNHLSKWYECFVNLLLTTVVLFPLQLTALLASGEDDRQEAYRPSSYPGSFLTPHLG